MTYREEKFVKDMTEIAVELAELRAENKILKSVNDRLLQALPVYGVMQAEAPDGAVGAAVASEGQGTVAARRLLPHQLYCSECGYVMPKSYFKIHNCAELREGQP